MKALGLVFAGHGILFAASAYANPIAMEVTRIREVPGPHVQLTYAVEYSGKSPNTPSIPATFGSKSTPWKTASYSANTGSGVRGLNGIQMCDCNVPLGESLVYKITVASVYDGRSVDYTLRVTPTGTGKYDAGAGVAPAIDAGLKPWEIPDPVEIQGIDCTAECASVQPLDAGAGPWDAQGPSADVGSTVVLDAAVVADVPLGTGGTSGTGGALSSGGAIGGGGVVSAGGAIAGTGGSAVIAGTGGVLGQGGSSTTPTQPTKSDDSGCSIGHGAGSPGLFVLAILGLALIGKRKRRA